MIYGIIKFILHLAFSLSSFVIQQHYPNTSLSPPFALRGLDHPLLPGQGMNYLNQLATILDSFFPFPLFPSPLPSTLMPHPGPESRPVFSTTHSPFRSRGVSI